jgi:hypothetical protein
MASSPVPHANQVTVKAVTSRLTLVAYGLANASIVAKL